ncbi:MAG: amino acid ABC transporter permease, partial [Enterobacteriaceae bacterium]
VVLVVLVVLANDHLIMITAHFPLFFLKIRHFFYRYQLVDPKDPTYNSSLILDGLCNTLILAALITLSGLVAGIVLLYFLTSKQHLIRKIAEGYVSFFKGTPLIALLFVIYYGSPTLGWHITAFEAALAGFTLNVAAYNASYLLSSYLAIDPSELEAAESMGFSKLEIYWYIILPQTVVASIPTLTNQAMSNLKDTALVFLIGYTDFFARMQEVATENFQFLLVYSLVAIVYLLITSVILWVAKRIERHFRFTVSTGQRVL